jgi:hypothetical protein
MTHLVANSAVLFNPQSNLSYVDAYAPLPALSSIKSNGGEEKAGAKAYLLKLH